MDVESLGVSHLYFSFLRFVLLGITSGPFIYNMSFN